MEKEIRIRKRKYRKGECSFFPEGDYREEEIERKEKEGWLD